MPALHADGGDWNSGPHACTEKRSCSLRSHLAISLGSFLLLNHENVFHFDKGFATGIEVIMSKFSFAHPVNVV